ncbi:MAG: phosphoglucosamine mutase [Chloroherpetonaceae bacterium]|nr:phosphoglucosamine mutase [Chloroherpetonaceae bacterium]
MSLMVSISGIRGIIGESLTPNVISDFTQAYATLLRHKRSENSDSKSPLVVLGRDTRPSGITLMEFVQSTLVQSGCNVINLGVATTPSVELAVLDEKAAGGIILSASHNPLEWNALKLLNELGEFLTADESNRLLSIYHSKKFHLAQWNQFGMTVPRDEINDFHIRKVLSIPSVDTTKLAKRNFKILIDAVNGAGSKIIPSLCRALGFDNLVEISCKPTGIFPRNPEPIEENLIETQGLTAYHQCDFGIVVDPDVDRVCFISEDGSLFGEEYSLVAAANFWLKHHRGPVVSNLSSSRALKDIALKHEVPYFASKVGEAHVIEKMKAVNAVIGGEGNGGVILPDCHYGRDALVGIVLFLASFDEFLSQYPTARVSDFKKSLPHYEMAKQKVKLNQEIQIDSVLDRIANKYQTVSENTVSTEDGVKIDFPDKWVHLRKSNTEPIIRIYAEAKTKSIADTLADSFRNEIIST